MAPIPTRTTEKRLRRLRQQWQQRQRRWWRRFGLYFDILDHNVETDDFERFITPVIRLLR